MCVDLVCIIFAYFCVWVWVWVCGIMIFVTVWTMKTEIEQGKRSLSTERVPMRMVVGRCLRILIIMHRVMKVCE